MMMQELREPNFHQSQKCHDHEAHSSPYNGVPNDGNAINDWKLDITHPRRGGCAPPLAFTQHGRSH